MIAVSLFSLTAHHQDMIALTHLFLFSSTDAAKFGRSNYISKDVDGNSMSNENLSASQTQNNGAGVGSFTLEGKTLSGRRSHYQIAAQINAQPGVRIYKGTELKSNAAVIVKEYYSFWWTIADIQQIELELEQLETIEFRSGGVQDFRLLMPQDVFASIQDQRCYLVLRPPQQHRSLRCYLEDQGRFAPATVRALLSQILQTLWFLHNQMIDFADGETQKGTAHGNLNLDSVLIASDTADWTEQFQVYLQDLELWEAVVRPRSSKYSKVFESAKTTGSSDIRDDRGSAFAG